MKKRIQIRLLLACLLAAALSIGLGGFLNPRGSAASDLTPLHATHSREPDEALPPAPERSIALAVRTWMTQTAALDTTERDDPFSYLPPAPAPTNPPLPISPPVLRGISLGSGRPLAVLDRSVVGEGEELGPWRVVRIEADVVWVEGPFGRVGLRVSRDPRPSSPSLP